MATFHLQIVTPDRMVYDGQAERVIVRTLRGDVCILARHIDYARDGRRGRHPRGRMQRRHDRCGWRRGAHHGNHL